MPNSLASLPVQLNPLNLNHYMRPQATTTTSRLIDHLYTLALFIIMFRLIAVSACIRADTITTYLYYDDALSVVYYQFAIKDGILWLVGSVTLITILFIHYTLRYTAIEPFLGILNCLVTVEDLHEESNYNWIPWIRLWRIRTDKTTISFPHKEHCFSSLSYEYRKRLYIAWKASVLMQNYFILFYLNVVIGSIAYFYLPAIKSTPFHWTLATFDIALCIFATINIFKECFFLGFLILIISRAAIYELSRLNSLFILRHRFGGVLLHCRTLATFRSQHTAIIRFLGRFNRQVVSPFYFMLVTTALAFNIYGLLYIQFYKPPTFIATFLYFIIAFESILPLLLATILVQLNSLVSVTRGGLYRMLLSIKLAGHLFSWNALLKEMLKSSTYFEQLNSKRKPAVMTVGIFGEINRRALLQFIILYFAYMKKVVKSFRARMNESVV